jgi:hypothetical protein
LETRPPTVHFGDCQRTTPDAPRPHSPGEALRGRHEEEGPRRVSQAPFAAAVRSDIGLIDHGEDHPVDEKPFTKVDGIDGLDVEGVLRPVVRSDAEVGVVLEGEADQIRQGFWTAERSASSLAGKLGLTQVSLAARPGETRMRTAAKMARKTTAVTC